MSLAAVNVASCHVAPHTRPSHLLDAGCRGRMMGLFHPFQPKDGFVHEDTVAHQG